MRSPALRRVSALPLIAGLSSSDYDDPEVFADGFDTAMLVMAALAAVGGVLAFVTIRENILEQSE